MNNVYFACRTCKIFVDAGYRWCYWALEEPGVVEPGKPVNVGAVLNASQYWHGAQEAAWLQELLPKVRAFLERHGAHDLIYGDSEDIGTVPMSDDDYSFLDWLDETDDDASDLVPDFDVLPRFYVEKLGYRDWKQVTDHIARLELKPWWWHYPELRQKAKEKFYSLIQ